MDHKEQTKLESPFAKFAVIFGILGAVYVPLIWAAELLKDSWAYAAKLYGNMVDSGSKTAAAVGLAAILLAIFSLIRKEEKKNLDVAAILLGTISVALVFLYFGSIQLV
ncbi:MAG: hypothetical protein VB092_09160 [Oscillospiraceae bacterium]|nr:hypothetical protein [Oscillospiraceae bacterium]